MSRRAFFVYERGLKGPTPAVFYDAIPTVDGKPPDLLGRHAIPDGTANADAFPFEGESPDFAALARMFPAPDSPAPAQPHRPSPRATRSQLGALPMKTVIIVNGGPRVGKDTAIEFMRRVMHREEIATAVFSSIDPIREMLAGAGFDIASKTEGDRKLLSVVGDAAEEHCEYRTTACLKRTMAFFEANPGRAVMFLHVREPHLIERLRHALRTYPRDAIEVRTVRVASEARGLRITSNPSDRHVDDFDYDVTVHNEGMPHDLHDACRAAVAVLLAGHCHGSEINI